MIRVRSPILQNPPRLMDRKCVDAEWELGDLTPYSLRIPYSLTPYSVTPYSVTPYSRILEDSGDK